MIVYEPLTSVFGGDYSANFSTTTAQQKNQI